MKTKSDNEYKIDLLRDIKDNLDILHDMVRENWRVDAVYGGRDKPFSPEDKRAETILQETMRRMGNRYEAGLLWRSDK